MRTQVGIPMAYIRISPMCLILFEMFVLFCCCCFFPNTFFNSLGRSELHLFRLFFLPLSLSIHFSHPCSPFVSIVLSCLADTTSCVLLYFLYSITRKKREREKSKERSFSVFIVAVAFFFDSLDTYKSIRYMWHV